MLNLVKKQTSFTRGAIAISAIVLYILNLHAEITYDLLE